MIGESIPGLQALIHDWGPPPASVRARAHVEDDTLRDGLQAAFARRPSVEERCGLLSSAARIGVRVSTIGFPASSPREHDDCARMIAHIRDNGLGVRASCLARAHVPDLEPIARLNDSAGIPVWADFFLGMSPLRRRVEGWALEDLLRRLADCAAFLRRAGCPFGFSIEDATRTPPDDLRTVIETAAEGGVAYVVLCDTVGASTPDSAAAIVRFAAGVLRDARSLSHDGTELWWHGHNDRGLALANALAAVDAGADTISGTFLGIGERTGNTPLEQVIVHLWQSGSTRFQMSQLKEHCATLARAVDIPIPESAPIVGGQAFATCTGTHAAAILKARSLGIEHEDYIFSSVPASRLGRQQDVLIGAASGLANARHALEQLGLPVTDALALDLLARAKAADRRLMPQEIQDIVAASSAGRGGAP